MTTDESGVTPEAAQVLVQMHQLLWHAGVQAHRRARESQDLDAVDLAFNLSHLCAQVYDLVPAEHRHALVDRPEVTGADPVDLAGRAAGLARAVPTLQFLHGTDAVVLLLDDTLRGFS